MPGEAHHQGDRFCLFRPKMELAIGWMTEQLKGAIDEKGRSP